MSEKKSLVNGCALYTLLQAEKRRGCTNRGYKSARIVDEAVLRTVMATLFTDDFIADLTADVNKRLAWIARHRWWPASRSTPSRPWRCSIVGGPTDRDGVPVPVWDSIHASPGAEPAPAAGPAEVIVPLIYDRKAAARRAAEKRDGAA